MYPLTENMPKPLLDVGGKTILNRLLEDIDGIAGIDSLIVVSNHKFIGQFTAWKAAQTFRNPITILDDGSIDNDHRLGAVADIRFAAESLSLDDDLLVAAGDNILDFSLQGFVDFAREKQTSCVMCHEENDLKKQQRTGIITCDPDWLITSYEEKPLHPKGNLAVPPFYVYRSADVKRIPEALADGCSADAPGSLAAWLSRRTPLHAYPMPAARHDIGDLATYEAIKKNFYC